MTLPMHDPRVLGLVLIIALGVVFAPQVDPTDYTLNTRDLGDGLAIYENPDYVYPPWSLIFLQPYRWMTATGARIAGVLVIAWLAYWRGWQARDFLAIVLHPLFVFTMLFSNIDLLVFVFAVLLWEAAKRVRLPVLEKVPPSVWRGLALTILAIKPQGSFLLVPYLLWRERDDIPALARAIGVAIVCTLPISLLGSPPLLLQWIDNIFNPSTGNVDAWLANNISLTDAYGLPLALIITGGVMGATGLLIRARKRWTHNHTLAALLLMSMLLSPYTSTQSVIAALAFVPSWIAIALHYALTAITSLLGVYLPYAGIWILVFGVTALWFAPARHADSFDDEHTRIGSP